MSGGQINYCSGRLLTRFLRLEMPLQVFLLVDLLTELNLEGGDFVRQLGLIDL